MTREYRVDLFKVGDRVIMPDGERLTVQAMLDNPNPFWIDGRPIAVPCTRLTDFIPGRGPISTGGSCSSHPDCRADWVRNTEWGRRNSAARGRPVRPKSRRHADP